MRKSRPRPARLWKLQSDREELKFGTYPVIVLQQARFNRTVRN